VQVAVGEFVRREGERVGVDEPVRGGFGAFVAVEFEVSVDGLGAGRQDFDGEFGAALYAAVVEAVASGYQQVWLDDGAVVQDDVQRSSSTRR